jgi:hypothetical protein
MQKKSRSAFVSVGTFTSSQMMESSLGARVTEENSPRVAQSGIAAFGSSLQMANRPGRTVNLILGKFSLFLYLNMNRAQTTGIFPGICPGKVHSAGMKINMRAGKAWRI